MAPSNQRHSLIDSLTVPRHTRMDIEKMRAELHRMKMALIGALEDGGLERNGSALLMRGDSVRGRNLHVMGTIRYFANRNQWKRDYVSEESGKVVVYVTSCGVVHVLFERCREVLDVLRALQIQTEVRDVYINPKYMDELMDRMQLTDVHKDLVFDSLPMVYVNGRYFGNDSTIFEENESKSLKSTFRDFQGRNDCNLCAGTGYTICEKCRGGKKTEIAFKVRLRCASCNTNGIAPCTNCTPTRRAQKA